MNYRKSISRCSSEIVPSFNRILEDLWLKETYQSEYKTIKRYPDLNSDTIATFSEDMLACTKHAHRTREALLHWASLPAENRAAIIRTYCRLFQPQLKDFTGEQITLLFCQIFLAEFVPHLCELLPKGML